MCRANTIVPSNISAVAFNFAQAPAAMSAAPKLVVAAPTFAATPAAAAGQKTSQAGIIFANRYKTKLCRQYAEDPVTGVATCSCPYKKKCMFAHDRAELRTPEMNLAEGLLTKEDIRAFTKRCKALKAQKDASASLESMADVMPAEYHQLAGAPLYMCGQTSSPSRSQSSNAGSDVAHGLSSTSSQCAATFIPIECPNHRRPYTTQEVSQGFYTHSPYGLPAVGAPSAASGWDYNSDCGCTQCINYWHSDAKLDSSL